MDLSPETILHIGAIVTIVVGFCEALKTAGLPSRFVPILAVLLGLGASYLFDGVSFLSSASGVILGLATTGGYRLIKTSILNQ